MVKDVQTGEIYRADHLVEAVLEGRLKGNTEARGEKAKEVKDEDPKKAKKKKNVKSEAIRLDDEVVTDIEYILAKVSRGLGRIEGRKSRERQVQRVLRPGRSAREGRTELICRLTTITVPSSASSSANTTFAIPPPTTN